METGPKSSDKFRKSNLLTSKMSFVNQSSNFDLGNPFGSDGPSHSFGGPDPYFSATIKNLSASTFMHSTNLSDTALQSLCEA
mgnify:CR=1 FL=1